LDVGMKVDVLNILEMTTKLDERQTMLFSATFPPQLEEFTKGIMKNNPTVVNIVEITGSVYNEQVEHKIMICPVEHILVHLALMLIDISQSPTHKVIVFFPTAHSTRFFHHLFSICYFPDLFEIHSKLNQSKRNSTCKLFSQQTKGIMFSSDVSARGIDYPDITDIIQFGLPLSSQGYIHRLGRTGRIGKSGSGLLLISDWEKSNLFDRVFKTPSTTTFSPIEQSSPKDKKFQQINEKLVFTARGVPDDLIDDAYFTMIAGYWGFGLKKNLAMGLIDNMNKLFTVSIGRMTKPKVSKKKAQKINLTKFVGIDLKD